MPLRVLVLQHHPTSPTGILGARMAARRVATTTIDAQHGATLR